MNEISKSKWGQLTPVARTGIVAASITVAIVFAVKILPALLAAMGVGALLAVLFLPYWLPTIVGFARRHPSKGAIFAVNFFFGWTFIGGVISLIWALGDNSGRGTSVVVNTTVSPSLIVGGGVPVPAPAYRIGDVVNGHRYNGMSWVPEPPVIDPAPPATPADASQQQISG